MKTKSTFAAAPANWDFVDEIDHGAWRMCIDHVDYPRHAWQSTPGDLLCPDGVTLSDYAFFAAQWLSSDCLAPDYCNGADLDRSSDVTIEDMIIFTEHWLTGVTL